MTAPDSPAVAELRKWAFSPRRSGEPRAHAARVVLAELDEARRELAAGAGLIATERRRQTTAERWTPEHDDEHRRGELASAAACYALARHPRAIRYVVSLWPWHSDWWKPVPGDRVRELVKAGALIAAEIDRLGRLADAPAPSPTPDPTTP